MEIDKLTGKVIGCAIEVHRALGPGLLESVYESCLIRELEDAGLNYKAQVPVSIKYKQSLLDLVYRIDLIVEQKLLLELKSVELVTRLHESQVLTYLKLSGLKTGLLINFDTTLLKTGVRRFKL